MPASDWSDLCQQTIVWDACTGHDSYGAPLYAGPPVEFSPANQQGGRRVFKTVRRQSPGAPSGSAMEYVNGSEIILLATPDIGLEDHVYVFGDAAPYPAIVDFKKEPDETGVDLYCKVTLGPAV